MDVASLAFSYVRTLMVAGTGGADIGECLLVAQNTKKNDIESWIREWAIAAEKVARKAEQAMQAGQLVTAREAYMRASNYYRAAMFYLAPTDVRLNAYIALSREHFRKAAALFTSPRIEVVDIPFGDARLPAYFLSSGNSKRPTLIAVNGGDSTNEELIHWYGFAAVARGWNFFVFEGPGQWSALQMNPGLYLRPDYEVPVKTIVDYLVQREEVDSDSIALIGPSMGAVLAARVAAFEKRISAYIFNGLVIDVNEAWTATMPALLRNAPPSIFDRIFTLVEKISPELRGLANHFRWMFGVSTPTEMFAAWPRFSVKGLAPKIQSPVLLMYGEGEFKETSEKVIMSVLEFINEFTCPAWIHIFQSKDGWAASHCQVGALHEAQAVIFDWLDATLKNKNHATNTNSPTTIWNIINKYHRTNKMLKLQESIRIKEF